MMGTVTGILYTHLRIRDERNCVSHSMNTLFEDAISRVPQVQYLGRLKTPSPYT